MSPGRWWSWESVTLYDDRDITAQAELKLRAIGEPPAAEKFNVHAHFGDSKAGQFAFANNKTITVEVRDRPCEP